MTLAAMHPRRSDNARRASSTAKRSRIKPKYMNEEQQIAIGAYLALIMLATMYLVIIIFG